MKKFEYQAPEMEVVELENSQALLQASNPEEGGGGSEEF